ncbi:UNVERIFIED_CONTAM: hypothetical protein GTU68_044428 [Idotea baltica]|nr:hypothetical protein [Idotea baltica]
MINEVGTKLWKLFNIHSSIDLFVLGFTGESYAFGTQLSAKVFGVILGIFTAGYLVLPVIYPLKLISINQYLQMRFNSRLLRLISTSLTVFKGFIIIGICIYAPAIALSAVTSVSWVVYVVSMGLVVTVYSSLVIIS